MFDLKPESRGVNYYEYGEWYFMVHGSHLLCCWVGGPVILSLSHFPPTFVKLALILPAEVWSLKVNIPGGWPTPFVPSCSLAPVVTSSVAIVCRAWKGYTSFWNSNSLLKLSFSSCFTFLDFLSLFSVPLLNLGF